MSGMSEIGRRPEGLTGPESNIVKNAVEQGTERMNPAVLADLEGYGKKMKPSVLADLEGRTKKPELSMQNSLAEGKEKIKDVVINAAENIPIKALRPEIIQTYNQNLEGQVHPNADVRYGKSIFMFNGKIMEGVFPRFQCRRVIRRYSRHVPKNCRMRFFAIWIWQNALIEKDSLKMSLWEEHQTAIRGIIRNIPEKCSW